MGVIMDAAQAQLWQEDLDFLAERIRTRHANPYHRMTRETFEAAVDEAHELIPLLEQHQAAVELARILALVGDGHSSFWITDNRSLNFHRYPLRFYHFSDGVFVTEAEAAQQEYLGMRLVQVGDLLAEAALECTHAVISRDNTQGLRLAAPFALSIPEVLHTLGMTERLGAPVFVLQDDDGKRVIAQLPLLAPNAVLQWTKWHENETPLALWQRNPEKLTWFEYLEAQQLVYVQHRAVRDMAEESLADFCTRLFAFIETHEVERLVIDLRSNGGGNNMLNQALVHGLICCRKINQQGKLFTLIGRRTFSAAMNLAVDLERHTKTLFVGEPTGAPPNFYGETTENCLPHSGISFSVSSLYWQSSLPYDQRLWIEPHLPAEMTSDDYRNNVDPALDAVISYVHEVGRF
jgi:hypothetical protein